MLLVSIPFYSLLYALQKRIILLRVLGGLFMTHRFLRFALRFMHFFSVYPLVLFLILLLLLTVMTMVVLPISSVVMMSVMAVRVTRGLRHCLSLRVRQ